MFCTLILTSGRPGPLPTASRSVAQGDLLAAISLPGVPVCAGCVAEVTMVTFRRHHVAKVTMVTFLRHHVAEVTG